MNIRDILGVPHFNDNKPRVRQAENRKDYHKRGVRASGDAMKSVGKVHKESGLRY
jgi:hypothetical protein